MVNLKISSFLFFFSNLFLSKHILQIENNGDRALNGNARVQHVMQQENRSHAYW